MYFLPQCLFLRFCFSFLSLPPSRCQIDFKGETGTNGGWREGKATPIPKWLPFGNNEFFCSRFPEARRKEGGAFIFFSTPVSPPELGILSNQPPGTFSQLFSILSSTWLFLFCLQTWVSSFVLKKKKKKDLILPVFNQMFFPGCFFLSLWSTSWLRSLGPNQKYLYF